MQGVFHLRNTLRLLTPPIFWSAARRLLAPSRLRRSTEYKGRYASFEVAAQVMGVTADDGVLKDQGPRTSESVDSIEGMEQRLALALLYVMAHRGALKHVVDVGGAFGTHYRTYSKIAAMQQGVCEWLIVELPTVADIARRRGLSDLPLRYTDGLGRSLTLPNPDLIIVSGVLQSLADPYGTLGRCADQEPSYLFIDRTPVTLEPDDFVSIRNVPGEYYVDGVARQVPYWFFSQRRFDSELSSRFEVVWSAPGTDSYLNLEGTAVPVSYRSRLLRVISPV